MSNLGDQAISEKGRVYLVIIQTLAAITATAFIVDTMKLWDLFRFFEAQGFEAEIALTIMLWGGVMLAFSRAIIIGRLVLSGLLGVTALAIRAGVVASLAIFGLALAVPAALARPILGPAFELYRLRWQKFWQPVSGRVENVWAARARERKLRHAYRTEFKGQFPSYRAFRAHFDAVGGEEEKRSAAQAADPFRAACRVLGLPEDGNFSEAAFKARYRDLMKSVHPDVAGPNDRAASVNAASRAIRERKGWS